MEVVICRYLYVGLFIVIKEDAEVALNYYKESVVLLKNSNMKWYIYELYLVMK